MGKDIGNGAFLRDRQLFMIMGYFFALGCAVMFIGGLEKSDSFWFLLPGALSALCFVRANRFVVPRCRS